MSKFTKIWPTHFLDINYFMNWGGEYNQWGVWIESGSEAYKERKINRIQILKKEEIFYYNFYGCRHQFYNNMIDKVIFETMEDHV